MTKWLLNKLTAKGEPLDSPAARGKVGKLSGIVGICCNVLLFAGKLTVGILSGAVAVTADAMNNLTDAASSVVTLLGFKLAEKPADSEHPYGHARFEYLSGLGVAALIVVIGFELAKTSVEKILDPQPVEISLVMGCVLAASVLVKIWLSLFNRSLGKAISSTTLLATAADSRNDVIATLAVLAAAVFEGITRIPVDGYVGFGVALFILYSGVELGKQTISPLLGEAASPELRQMIVNIVSKEDRVLGYHDLMVHDYGPGQRFASIHVEMDQKEDPLLCHELIDAMERDCLEQHNVHLVIHYDPVVTGDAELDTLRACVKETLGKMDERLTVHDFRMVKRSDINTLFFDVSIPQSWKEKTGEIYESIEKALETEFQSRHEVRITFDLEAFNL